MQYTPIPGWEHEYGISTDGTVLSYLTETTLKPSINKGYLQVQLCKDGKRYNKRVHVLVALTYVPNPDPEKLTIVDHKDCNKLNPEADNLEWVTQKENTRRAHANGLVKAKGTEVCQISKGSGKVVATYRNLREAEEKTGISHTAISRVLNGKRTSAGSYYWERSQ